ncbi:MAG: aldehyde dehydrogenase family protein, partial [Trueperaceae bacterium]
MPERSHNLTGRSWFGLAPCPAEPTARRFMALDPRSGHDLGPEFEAATPKQVRRATHLAANAARPMAALAGPKRAAFLRSVAEELEADENAIAARGSQETGLPDGRLRSELQRTTLQIRMFADLVEREDWRDPRIDPGDPARSPTPKRDVRSFRRALGPVVVFGASNFPLAFSVAGGDTVSALAAGCPVIVKAHPGHPGTSELAGAAIARAAGAHELPVGAFALLFDDGHEVGQLLVTAPEARAVAFTGSRAGGD